VSGPKHSLVDPCSANGAGFCLFRLQFDCG
jgi:hypothetical protein